MIGSAYTWRYHRILSFLHRSMRLMILVSTPEQRSDMASAAQRDRTETSLYVKPRWVPNMSLTVALRWAVIIEGLTFIQRTLGGLKGERGLSVGVCHVDVYGQPDDAMPPLVTIGGLLWPHFLFSHPACHFSVLWRQVSQIWRHLVHYQWWWQCQTTCSPHWTLHMIDGRVSCHILCLCTLLAAEGIRRKL